MTCEDCAYFEGCNNLWGLLLEDSEYLMNEYGNIGLDDLLHSIFSSLKPKFQVCPKFKGRSRFVELPCKAGTTVYTVSLKHGVVPWGVYAICSMVTEWDAAPKITLLARSKKIDKSAKFSANAISTSVFFTREEAKQALKEREENG